MERNYSAADRLLMRLGQTLAHAQERKPARASPAADAKSSELDETTRRHVAGLMRVNHAGEVAAQALYHGQALVARDPRVRDHLLAAAREEQDHLAWCEQRLAELGEAPSRLRGLWYAGSLAIGAAAGLAGDKVSLGFVEETEKQVSEHLDEHLAELPADDARSRRILETMRDEETRHGRAARRAGARDLPAPVRALMRRVAKVMKFGAYRI
jgi:ubiquinone biosynthesis monooxygenase Coq7